jgi:hypothetical protein
METIPTTSEIQTVEKNKLLKQFLAAGFRECVGLQIKILFKSGNAGVSDFHYFRV